MVATGHQHSVRDLIEVAAGKLDIRIAWEGKGLRRRARCGDGKADRCHRPALLPPDRGGHAAGRSLEGSPEAGLGAQDQLRGAGHRDGHGRPEGSGKRHHGAAEGLPHLRQFGIGSLTKRLVTGNRFFADEDDRIFQHRNGVNDHNDLICSSFNFHKEFMSHPTLPKTLPSMSQVTGAWSVRPSCAGSRQKATVASSHARMRSWT